MSITIPSPVSPLADRADPADAIVDFVARVTEPTVRGM